MTASRPVISRRAVLCGTLVASGLLVLPGCATTDTPFTLAEAIRRLLVLSSERAFVRLTQPGGFWDRQVAGIGMGAMLGTRGDSLSRILTSGPFKARLERVVADAAVDASYRAAPMVEDAVRTVGIDNALALVRGGPTAATDFLRREMGGRLLDALVPGIGEALHVMEDPLMGELLSVLAGVDVAALAGAISGTVEEAIWSEIAAEEAAIRADPAATRDPVLIAVFAGNAAL